MPTWDAELYRTTFTDERSRPFVDLLARIDADAPAHVVDLGCGPGHLTPLLTRRWPGARVTGVDSSPEMIARARAGDSGRGIGFEVADLREWRPATPVDVVISNAVLQWVPDHLDLLPGLLDQVADGGWLAFQVPSNTRAPSHALRAELEADPRFVDHAPAESVRQVPEPATYLDALAALGCQVDAWETTYLHRLTGPDPVYAWVGATSARPILQALPAGLREEFEAELRSRLAQAYPARHGAVTLPFRRIFVVAHKAASRRAPSQPERPSVTRLHHVQLACPPGGEDAARRFYVGGLGLTEVDKPDALKGRGGAWFRGYDDLGEISIELHLGIEAPFTPARKAHPALLVGDLDAVAARLRAAGAEVDERERSTFPGHLRFHTFDPHGNRVEVLQQS